VNERIQTASAKPDAVAAGDFNVGQRKNRNIKQNGGQ
jgi:hypothetical protein